MDAVLHAGLSNAVTAAVLGLVALGVTLAWSNPYVARCLWAVVLLKLLMPPLWEVPVFRYRQEVAETKSSAMHLDTIVLQSQPVRAPAIAPSPAAPYRTSASAPVASPVEPTQQRVEAVEEAQMAPNQPSQVARFPSLGTLWLLISGLVAAVIGLRVVQFRRLLRQAAVAPPRVEDLARQVAARLGLRGLPRLRIVDGTLPPLMWSAIGQPTVLLPARLLDRLAPQELEAVLAHELAHVRRRDGVARWLEMAAICAYWWHPVTWLARHKLQQAEEECCDADVLRAFPESRRGYAHALLKTLEFLVPRKPTFTPATGFTQRRCLIRRFEMIVRKHPTSRPARSTRMLIVSAALVALATFPVALPAESKDGKNDREPERIACTITLKDGTKIEGYIVRLADDRVVVQRKQMDDSSEIPRLDPATELDLSASGTPKEQWEISLRDCVAISLTHAPGIRPLRVVRIDGKLALTGESDDPKQLFEAQAGVASILRDVETAYWILWLKYREHEAAKSGRDRALKIWRTVYEVFEKDPARKGAREEAQCRTQFFAYRKLVSTSLSDLIRAENRLRYLLGLATHDGRVIQPLDSPSTDKVEFEWDSVHAEALAKRTELMKSRLYVLDRTAEFEMAKLQLGFDDENAMLRHHQLLVSREEALLRDTELEVSHQVADALRNAERGHELIQSRFDALVEAQQEFEDLRYEYELENVQIDFLLDALARRTDAERTFYQAVAEYALADALVHERKGTLLERHGIKIANGATAEPEVEQ
jgi:beta-lactamase regulating signal transducer with metallopeptidase domain